MIFLCFHFHSTCEICIKNGAQRPSYSINPSNYNLGFWKKKIIPTTYNSVFVSVIKTSFVVNNELFPILCHWFA